MCWQRHRPGACRPRGQKAAAVLGRWRHDPLALSALLSHFITRRSWVFARHHCNRMFDGVHHLLCIQHGTDCLDHRCGGFSLCACEAVGCRRNAWLRSFQHYCFAHVSFAHQSRWKYCTFCIYGAFCILTLFFVRFVMPETKGCELESISAEPAVQVHETTAVLMQVTNDEDRRGIASNDTRTPSSTPIRMRNTAESCLAVCDWRRHRWDQPASRACERYRRESLGDGLPQQPHSAMQNGSPPDARGSRCASARSIVTARCLWRDCGGAPGVTNVDKGVVIATSYLMGWRDVPLRQMLEAEFGVPAAWTTM
jgi:hypothetical protein